MSHNDKKQYFESRRDQFYQEYLSKKRQASVLGWVRFISFVIVAYVIYLLFQNRETAFALFTFILYVPCFGLLINRHNRKNFELQLAKSLTQVNDEEILRIDRQLKTFPDGNSYLHSGHPYAPDLDIFGKHSLFQLLNRSRFVGSQDTLAAWLSSPATTEEINARQAAIRELSEDLDWNQKHTAYSLVHVANKEEEKLDLTEFVQGLESDTQVPLPALWSVAQIALPLATLSLIISIEIFAIPFQWIFLAVGINFLLLRVVFQPLLNLTKNLSAFNRLLKGYELLIRDIETRDFESPHLTQLKDKFGKNHAASSAIRQLRISLDFLTNRGNMIYQIINSLLLTDLMIIHRIKRWHQHHSPLVLQWFSAVDQVVALSDLATYTFVESSYSFPRVEDQPCQFATQKMRHPLLLPTKSVSNDFSLSGKGKLALVTGSNMSGKSTFLRTLGINLVLAQAGAPVAAETLSFSPIRIFTSMRTQDNLEESVSSFYAEIRRIKQLLDELSEEQPTLYLLDEILKGTNTKDRHTGAIALIGQLTNSNCMGLISTHDVELAELRNPLMNNFSFNSTLENGEIHFDYQLTPGPCRSFNASALMEKMGIIKK
ncbi:hypothetical protein BFP72_15580 [Reichenbachiella sp. 5M10]|uniref:MutS-related protein n=1 Tax=Reichenbachiella sp. 5M10 TaxID=1889772 RepID=UPI000C161F4C|nr:hypothetical protein [Reichenbachiella sp. 5M10]PIB36718.1 hypothetical protein BFP72_15580 [Reichenbachiella sp. 5M10]